MPSARNSGSLLRRTAQWLGFVPHDDGTWGQRRLDIGARPAAPRPNTGSPVRRMAQWLGFVYNDDGTWGQRHLGIRRQGSQEPPAR